MKVFIILSLLLTTCAKKDVPTKSLVEDTSIRLEQNIVQATNVSDSDSLDKQDDLILMDNSFKEWYETTLRYPDNDVFSQNLNYLAVYWDQKTNYYRAFMRRTDNISFNLSNIRPDNVFWDDLKEEYSDEQIAKYKESLKTLGYSDPLNFSPIKLYYVGNISSNQRLYVDTYSRQQYIKTLEPITREYYTYRSDIDWNNIDVDPVLARESKDSINYALTLALYPLIWTHTNSFPPKTITKHIVYSNKNREFFKMESFYDQEFITPMDSAAILSDLNN